MRLYKALGVLLAYPTAELCEAVEELRTLVAEAPLSETIRNGLSSLLGTLERTPLLDLQEQYVDLFDRTKSLSLHLFEHVHGSGHDRGQAMVQLQTMYSQHGLEPVTGELPDFLPMLCEFLSMLPEEGARTMLGDLAVILGLLQYRLQERKSDYAVIPGALLELAKAPVDEDELRAVIAEEPTELPDMEALDRTWKEAEVTFGAGDAHQSCGGRSDDDLVQLRHGKA